MAACSLGLEDQLLLFQNIKLTNCQCFSRFTSLKLYFGLYMKLIFKTLLTLMILFNSPVMGSSIVPYDEKTPKSFESLLAFNIDECYRDGIVRDQQTDAFVIPDKELFERAKTTYSKGKDLEQKKAIHIFRQLAQGGHLSSMRHMGDLCLDRPKYHDRFAQALRWYICAFQMEYLTEGFMRKETLDRFTQLRTGKLSQQDPDVKSFFNTKHFGLFFNLYKDINKHHDFCALNKIVIAYNEGVIEPFLSLENKKKKENWFWFHRTKQASDPHFLIKLAGSCKTDKQYDRALFCFKRANTPESLLRATYLYLCGHIQNPDAAFVVEEFERLCLASGLPDAMYNIGLLFHIGQADSIKAVINIKKAARYYELAGDAKSLNQLGNIYEHGLLGAIDGRPNYAKAKDLYLLSNTELANLNLGRLELSGVLGSPDYAAAERHFIESNTDYAYVYLGAIYAAGQIGANDAGVPDYRKAAELFLLSKLSEGWLCLGYLYAAGKINLLADGEPDFRTALSYFSLSSSSDRFDKMLNIIDRKNNSFDDIAVALKTETPQQAIQQLCDKIKAEMHAWNKTEQAYSKGLLAYYESHDLETALLHFNTAYVLGHHFAQNQINRMEALMELEFLKDEERKLGTLLTWMQTIEDEEKRSMDLSDPLMAKQDEVAYETPDQQIVIEEASSEVSRSDEQTLPKHDHEAAQPSAVTRATVDARPKQYKPEKEKLTKEQKAQRVLQRWDSGIFRQSRPIGQNQQQAIGPLRITFIDAQVEKDYNSLNAVKLNELLADIYANPYAAQGVGQPELLRYPFKGLKGCYARRINQMCRLVYKYEGPGHIVIAGCDEHYKGQ